MSKMNKQSEETTERVDKKDVARVDRLVKYGTFREKFGVVLDRLEKPSLVISTVPNLYSATLEKMRKGENVLLNDVLVAWQSERRMLIDAWQGCLFNFQYWKRSSAEKLAEE